jgi:pimeloyl-ACP methyl ester carboxylesterase
MNSPIVFIHGSGDSARIWRLQMDYARSAHEIIFDELHLDHPIIAGHSLGGAIALIMGLEYASELGGLILIGTGARLRVHPDLLKGAKETPQQANLQLKQLSIAATTDPVLLAGPADEQTITGPNMLYRDLSACNIFDVMPLLSEIHLPTLIICGTEDRLTPVKYSEYLYSHCSLRAQRADSCMVGVLLAGTLRCA